MATLDPLIDTFPGEVPGRWSRKASESVGPKVAFYAKEKKRKKTTLWLFNIAMENGPFIDDFPLKPPFMRDFPWLC